MSAPVPEPCVAQYRVERTCGTITVFATGVHRTSGFVTYLTREPGGDFPPRFSLWHVRSTEPQLYVVTPFASWISFQTTRDVDTLEVRDARGVTCLEVEEVYGDPLLHDG
jgi:hypothetical protein